MNINPPPPIDNSPRWWNKGSKALTITWLFLFGYPLLITIINFTPPKQGELTAVNGRVIEIRNRAPHLLIYSKTAGELALEFPVFTNFAKPAEAPRILSGDKQKRFELSRCTETSASVQKLWLYPFERYRVWEIACGSVVILTYDELRLHWEGIRYKALIAYLVIGSLCYLLLFVASYIGEKKKI